MENMTHINSNYRKIPQIQNRRCLKLENIDYELST